MRNTIFVWISLFIFFSGTAYANPPKSDWEETLRKQVNGFIGNDNFQFESIKVQSSTKTVKGTGKFFGKSGIGFEASYHSENELASFKAIMPSKAKVKISAKEIKQLAGKDLRTLVPEAIKKGVYLDDFSFSLDKGKKEIKDLAFNFSCLRNWEVLESKDFKLERVKIHVNIKYPKSKNKRKYHSSIAGISQIGGVPVQLSANIPSKKEQLEFTGSAQKLQLQSSLASICGKSSIKGFSIPDKVMSLGINDVKISVLPYQKKAKFLARSSLGDVDAWVQKPSKSRKKAKSLDYVVVISPPKGFKASKINGKLKMLDKVDLSGYKIVLSSKEKSKKESSKIPSLSQVPAALKKGCNLVAKIDIRKFKIDHLIKAKEFVVSSPLSAKLDDVVLQSPLANDIPLGPSATLKEVTFLLRPSPKAFTLGLGGIMDVRVNGDELKFKGEVELILNTQTLQFLAMMKGKWRNPMGVKGLVISDLGIDMGASFAAPAMMPNVAMAGEMKIGRFKGQAAFAFDTRNPSKSMIAASFNQLRMADLVGLLLDPKLKRSIPKEVLDAANSIQLKNVELEVVPVSMEVLEKHYDAGFRAAGRVEVAGVGGEVELDIDYENGIYARGQIDPINLGVFTLRGANGKSNPGFILDLRKGKSPKAAVNGMVKLLGIQAEADIELKANGFSFMVGGKLFGIFNGKVYASGADIHKGGDMYLKIQMENDLLGFIDREVTNFINNEINAAVRELTKAQKALDDAKREVRKLDKKIAEKKKSKEYIDVAALETQKGIALGALETADAFLEGLKFTLGAAGRIATFVIKNGVKLLINVRAASFEGQLGAMNGGFVKMSCDLEWLGQRQQINFNFNFNKPSDSVKALAKSLLDKA